MQMSWNNLTQAYFSGNVTNNGSVASNILDFTTPSVLNSISSNLTSTSSGGVGGRLSGFTIAEQRLQDHLMRRYESSSGGNSKAVLPLWETSPPGPPVDVKVSFYLQSLDGVSPATSAITLNLWRRLSWVDVLLGWNSSNFDNLNQTIVDPDSIWTPGLYWYGQAGSAIETYVQSTWVFLYNLGSNTSGGRLYWTAPGRAELQCSEDDDGPWGFSLKRYPFDLHACSLSVGGWSDSGLRVNYSWMEENHPFSTSVAVDPIPSQTNGYKYVEDDDPLWKVEKVETRREENFYSCCPDEPWPVLKIFVYIRRSNDDIIWGIYLPIAVSVCMGFLSFLLPISCGERFGVGATALLTVFAIMFISKEGDPTVGAISLQSVYYFASMWYSIIPIIATSMVYKLSSGNENEITYWVQKLVVMFDKLCPEDSIKSFGRAEAQSGYSLDRKISVRHVWLMGRQKKVQVERNTSNTSSLSSSSSDRSSGVRISISNDSQNPFRSQLPSPSSSNSSKLSWEESHAFQRCLYRNVKCILHMQERRASRFATVTLATSSLFGYCLFILFFHLDTSEKYSSVFVRWLSRDLTRYYIYIVASTLLWLLLAGFIFIFVYTYRQRLQMINYRSLGEDIGVSHEYLDEIVSTFVAFDSDLNGIIPKDDLQMAFYRLSQKDEVVNFALNMLNIMDTNSDGVITFREFSIAIIEAITKRKAQQEELLTSRIMRKNSNPKLMYRKQQSMNQEAVEKWTVADVSFWLHAKGFFQYIQSFTTHGIDGQILLTISEDELRNDLKIKILNNRRKLMDAITDLKCGMLNNEACAI